MEHFQIAKTSSRIRQSSSCSDNVCPKFYLDFSDQSNLNKRSQLWPDRTQNDALKKKSRMMFVAYSNAIHTISGMVLLPQSSWKIRVSLSLVILFTALMQHHLRQAQDDVRPRPIVSLPVWYWFCPCPKLHSLLPFPLRQTRETIATKLLCSFFHSENFVVKSQ